VKALRFCFVHPLPPPTGHLSLIADILVLSGRVFGSADLTSLKANDAHVITAAASARYDDGGHECFVSNFLIVDEQGHRDAWRCGRG
jgi:hypothetical protein